MAEPIREVLPGILRWSAPHPSAGIQPHSISETWPDETALEIPGHRAVAVTDGVINYDGLGFFPDRLLGDDPAAEKQRLRDGFTRLTEEVDFDHLLLAHGTPIVGDGREQLASFAGARGPPRT